MKKPIRLIAGWFFVVKNEKKMLNFLNFHGQKKSLDYRLAAAIYGTPLWGAFMTDLVAINESKSDNVVRGKLRSRHWNHILINLAFHLRPSWLDLEIKLPQPYVNLRNARLKSYPIIQAQTDTGKLLIHDKQF